MPTKEALLTAIAGKGVERGLTPERTEDFVVLRYESETTERQDNLHKQSIRSLVQRIAPDWKIHIASMGETGFSVEVRPAPNNRVRDHDPQPEEAPLDLTNQGVRNLDALAAELEQIAKALRENA